jgi:hypothetical protein
MEPSKKPKTWLLEVDMRLAALMILTTGLLIDADAPKDDVTKKEKISPPEGHVVSFKVKAEGVQIYRCKAKGEWEFKAPEADLFDDKGKKIGKHYRSDSGPTWESTADGSSVVGKVDKPAAAPKADSIPWLLLKAISRKGDGLFSKITYIQRVDTEGGIMPSEKPANAAVGDELKVPYKAIYIFYREREKP